MHKALGGLVYAGATIFNCQRVPKMMHMYESGVLHSCIRFLCDEKEIYFTYLYIDSITYLKLWRRVFPHNKLGTARHSLIAMCTTTQPTKT